MNSHIGSIILLSGALGLLYLSNSGKLAGIKRVLGSASKPATRSAQSTKPATNTTVQVDANGLPISPSGVPMLPGVNPDGTPNWNVGMQLPTGIGSTSNGTQGLITQLGDLLSGF